ncbi:Putative transposase [Frankia alni ACN14a]|uniref:Transposase n=1 Tax=Frankia alni (strain DSM 45986 / CECT 9034 / ACN14a) TaxID=326424 RepID=Q0RT67_FRAAA|nr:Putative transposase [Frankia alni ACN14a]
MEKVRDVVGVSLDPPGPRGEVVALSHLRFHLRFTPTSSSWMNLVERWFVELSRRKLCRSTHRSVVELEAGIRKWISAWNKGPEAVRLDEDRRPESRNPRCLPRTNQRRRILGGDLDHRPPKIIRYVDIVKTWYIQCRR